MLSILQSGLSILQGGEEGLVSVYRAVLVMLKDHVRRWAPFDGPRTNVKMGAKRSFRADTR